MSTARATNAARAALPSTLLTARTFVVKAGIATPSLRTHPRHAATPSRTLLLSKRRAEPSVAARPAAWHGGGITTAGQQPLWRNQSGPVGAGAGGLEKSQSTAPAEETEVDSLCQKISFIGAGNMAKAIMGGMIRNGVQNPENITVFDVSKEQMDSCCAKFPGVKQTSNLFDMINTSDIVMIGVKPQNVEGMMKDLQEEQKVNGKLNDETIMVSIVAGIPLQAFQRYLDLKYIVRAMPNTPVTVEQGCTVWCATKEPKMPDDKKAMISRLFSSIGDEIYLEDERFLDMATAISGSGPAYVFLTMEAMIDAGVHMGFPRHVAERLVMNTLLGSCLYAIQSGEHVSKLRNDITSPGGTTASAIYNLERGGFRTTVSDAVWAAYRRSLELGAQDSNVGPGRHGVLPAFWQKDMRDDSS